MNDCVNKAKTIMEKEYKNISTLYDLSKKTGCNYHTLRSEFAREAGITLGHYLNMIRCQKAADLLKNTDWKLYRIAYEVGYHDEKYFMRIYKKIHGYCPSKIRN